MFKKLVNLITNSKKIQVALSLVIILAIIFPVVQSIIAIRKRDAQKEIPAEERLTRGIESLDDEEYSLALQEFSLAIEKDAHYAEAYLERGKLFLRAGEPGFAHADLSMVILRDPDNAEAYYQRALSYLELANILYEEEQSRANIAQEYQLNVEGQEDIKLDPSPKNKSRFDPSEIIELGRQNPYHVF